MPQIKAIIYDVDGTMVNSEPIHVDAWNKALNLYGHSLGDLSEMFRATMAGKKPIVNAEGMAKELGLAISPDELLEEKTKLFIQVAEREIQGMPGAEESVKRFSEAGYKLAIGTSLDRSYLNLVLSKLGVIDYFDVVITGDQIENGKPDPETYTRVADELRVPPNQCVVLEDAASGIKSAKAAGAFCIAVENKAAVEQDTHEADAVVASLNEVTLDLIKTMGL